MDAADPPKLQRLGAHDVEPLLAESFPVEPGKSFFDDFPLWRSPSAEWFGVVDGAGRVLACAGMVAGEWLVPGESSVIKVGRIGGVATAASLRGQGVASVLVEALIERARVLGLKAAILWGVESNLYKRLGFKGRGRQLRVPLHLMSSAPSRAPGVFRLEEGFSSRVIPLMKGMRREFGGMQLALSDAHWISQHVHTRWALVMNAQGDCVAYGAFGRGIDLGYQLHDWGGSGEALEMILRWASGLDSGAELMGPAALVGGLLNAGIPAVSSEETACMVLELESGTVPLDDEKIWFWGLDGV